MASPFDNMTNYPEMPAVLSDVTGDAWSDVYVCAGVGNYVQASTGVVRVFTGPDAPADDEGGIVLRPGDAPVLFMGLTLLRFRVADGSGRATVCSARRYHP